MFLFTVVPYLVADSVKKIGGMNAGKQRHKRKIVFQKTLFFFATLKNSTFVGACSSIN